MYYFDHEKLDVYQKTLEFLLAVEKIVDTFPKGRAYLVDQLLRASSSILLNISEGAGEFSSNEKLRFYRIARRSATECAGILDLCFHLRLFGEDIHSQTKQVLLRIVAMLTKMSRHFSQTQTVTQTQT